MTKKRECPHCRGPHRRGAHQSKVGKVMHEYKRGQLRSSSGQKVKKRKQAIAIALSEARRAGERVRRRPRKRRR